MTFQQQSHTAWFKLREGDKGKQSTTVTHTYQNWDYLKDGHNPPRDNVGKTGSRLKSLKKPFDPTSVRLAEEAARAQRYQGHDERRQQNLLKLEWRNGNAVQHLGEPTLPPTRERHRAPPDAAALAAEDIRRKRLGAGPEWSSRYHIQMDEKEQARLDYRYAVRKEMEFRQTAALIGFDRADLKSNGVRDNFQGYDHFSNTETSRDISANDWIKPARAVHKARDRDTIAGTDLDAAPKEENPGWLHHYRHRRSQTRNPIMEGEEPVHHRPISSLGKAHLSSNPITEWPVDNRTLSSTVVRPAWDNPLKPYQMPAARPYHASDPNPRAEPPTPPRVPRFAPAQQSSNPITHEPVVTPFRA